MNNARWEKSQDGRFAAFLCYDTAIPVFKTFKKKEIAALPLFEFAGISFEAGDPDKPAEAVARAGYEAHTMRLPYTHEMLVRREQYLREREVLECAS